MSGDLVGLVTEGRGGRLLASVPWIDGGEW